MSFKRKNSFEYSNVVGYSNILHRKIVKGKETSVLCQRIYVSRKKKVSELGMQNLIPAFVESRSIKTFGFKKKIPTDIIEVGELRPFKEESEKDKVDLTDRFRPVELGVSIGHWDITAGSLGMLYVKDEKMYAGSNAHVLSINASKPGNTNDKILQPGSHHGGQTLDNVVGNYDQHVLIKSSGETPTGCFVSKTIVSFFNTFLKLFKRSTRFKAVTDDNINHLDFGTYTTSAKHILKIGDNSIDLGTALFIGHLFGGSRSIGIICKVKYIEEMGYIPFVTSLKDVKVDDVVKGCSFWGNYQTKVSDPSAVVFVNYGSFSAKFEDVIIVSNTNVIKGGWSGSGWYKI